MHDIPTIRRASIPALAHQGPSPARADRAKPRALPRPRARRRRSRRELAAAGGVGASTPEAGG